MQSLASKKAFQNSLRALIVAGSISGFMGGWVFLAHSGKPVASGVMQQASALTIDLHSLAPAGNVPALQSPSQALPPLAPPQQSAPRSSQQAPQQPAPPSSQRAQPLPSLPRQQFAQPRLRSRGS